MIQSLLTNQQNANTVGSLNPNLTKKILIQSVCNFDS
jgi:hypothetical protein